MGQVGPVVNRNCSEGSTRFACFAGTSLLVGMTPVWEMSAPSCRREHFPPSSSRKYTSLADCRSRTGGLGSFHGRGNDPIPLLCRRRVRKGTGLVAHFASSWNRTARHAFVPYMSTVFLFHHPGSRCIRSAILPLHPDACDTALRAQPSSCMSSGTLRAVIGAAPSPLRQGVL
jgi:hypothetical protein